MSDSDDNQTAVAPPITDNPEVQRADVPSMTENKDPASLAENDISTDVPVGSIPVTAGNAADTCMASGVQPITTQNEIFAQLAQIPQDQLTNFFRALAGMSTVAQGDNITNVLPARSAAYTRPNTPAKSGTGQATMPIRENESLADFDITSTHRSRQVVDRSRRDMVPASDIEELDDTEDDTPRLGRHLARTTAQKNEYSWVLGNQTLPVAAFSEVAPPSRNPLMYTAYILNNLSRSSPDENLLWSILRSGGGVRSLNSYIVIQHCTNLY